MLRIFKKYLGAESTANKILVQIIEIANKNNAQLKLQKSAQHENLVKTLANVINDAISYSIYQELKDSQKKQFRRGIAEHVLQKCKNDYFNAPIFQDVQQLKIGILNVARNVNERLIPDIPTESIAQILYTRLRNKCPKVKLYNDLSHEKRYKALSDREYSNAAQIKRYFSWILRFILDPVTYHSLTDPDYAHLINFLTDKLAALTISQFECFYVHPVLNDVDVLKMFFTDIIRSYDVNLLANSAKSEKDHYEELSRVIYDDCANMGSAIGHRNISNLVASYCHFGFYSVNVKTLTGKTIIFEDVEAEDTVLKIKRKLMIKETFPVDLQRFIFNRCELQDDKTLRDCKVEDKSNIHLVLKL